MSTISTKLSYIFSSLSTLVRLGRGRYSRRYTSPPKVDIELYDFEACPFCRLVRETITELDLDVKVYPCPKGGNRYREYVKLYGGKAQFPFMVDRARGVKLYESSTINTYLYEQYGGGVGEAPNTNRQVGVVLSSLASLLRGASGTFARPSASFAGPPVLYGAEGCWKSRLVREELCVREITYKSVSVGYGSRKRAILDDVSAGLGTPVLLLPQEEKILRGVFEILSFLRS